MKRAFHRLTLVGVLLLLSISGCAFNAPPLFAPEVSTAVTVAPTQTESIPSGNLAVAVCPPPADGKMTVPLRTTLKMVDRVQTGGTTNIDYSVRALIPAPNMSITVTLPAGISLLEGALTWRGDLQAGEERVLTATVRLENVSSTAAIRGEALSTASDGTAFGLPCSLYAQADSNGFITISATAFSK